MSLHASRLAAILSLLLLAALGQAQDTTRRTLVSSALTRSYLLHVPRSYSPAQPLPLLICIHGYTGTGEAMENVTAFSDLAERQGFIVAYPDALRHAEADGNTTWFDAQGNVIDGNDRFIGDLIAALRRDFAVDQRQIYVTGMSQGGGMCYIAAAAYPDVVAAIAPVVVSLPTGLPFDALVPSRPMAVLMINGTADPLIPYDGGVGVGGVQFLAVPDLASRLAAHDGCFPFAFSWGLPNWNWFDGCAAGVISYGWGAQGTEVQLYTVTGGGHTWPGTRVWLPQFIFGNTCQDFDASRVIWDFLVRHPLPAGIAN